MWFSRNWLWAGKASVGRGLPREKNMPHIQYRMYTSFFILVICLIEIISDNICEMTDEGVPDLDSLTQDETECGNGIIKPDDR